MAINKQLFYGSLLLICTIIFFGKSSFDIFIQDYFFDFDSLTWILDRDLEPWKFIFYDGIKKLLIVFAVATLFIFLFFRNRETLKEYKQGLLLVVLSAIIVPIIIGGLKKTTNMPCPKNEIHFGGNMIRTAVWEKYPEPFHSMEKIACYPAGHASGGFALMSLFFLFKKRKNKFIALVVAIGIGWSMGIYKMAIGDHFFSHTLITMILAWLIILCLYFLTKRLIPPTA